MTDQTQTPEAQEVPAKAAKAPKEKLPCLCSRLEALENVHETENGDLDWDAEHNTGCPGTLTTKVFAPGHDAKAVGFLIDMYAKGPGVEVARMDGGVRVVSDPESLARNLGDALYAKFTRGVTNIDKRNADRAAREATKAATKAEAEAKKAAKAAERAAAKAAKEADAPASEGDDQS